MSVDAAHRHHHEHAVEDDSGLADLLTLDAEVLHGYWAEVLTAVRHAGAGVARRRIVDLGAGTGTATIGLAQRFAGAEVVAVDSSESMVRRVRAAALDLGLAPRVRAVHADLDAGLPDLGPIDLTWASLSLHHLADPDQVLTEVFAATRPGGLVAVVEMAAPVRFLPDDIGLGRPGLEARCLAALEADHARALPHLGADWPARLAAAGFSVRSADTITIALDPPHPRATARYAHLWLDRLRSGVSGHLADDDREVLSRLLDGTGRESVWERADLQLRGARTLTLARR